MCYAGYPAWVGLHQLRSPDVLVLVLVLVSDTMARWPLDWKMAITSNANTPELDGLLTASTLSPRRGNIAANFLICFMITILEHSITRPAANSTLLHRTSHGTIAPPYRSHQFDDTRFSYNLLLIRVGEVIILFQSSACKLAPPTKKLWQTSQAQQQSEKLSKR